MGVLSGDDNVYGLRTEEFGNRTFWNSLLAALGGKRRLCEGFLMEEGDKGQLRGD